jgi:ribosomal protein S18 acetylase RimI-like enzyme
MEIEFTSSPLESDVLSIYSGLVAFNEPQFPGLKENNMGFFVRDQNETVIGGIVAKHLYTSFHINYLWLHASIRSLGIGRELIQRVEHEARALGVVNIYLDTYTFQAPGFYKKYGFKEVGRYVDYPKQGIDKIFFQKTLSKD